MNRENGIFGHCLRKQRQCFVISGDHKRTLYFALLTWIELRNCLSRVVALGTVELWPSQAPTDKEESATFLSGVLRPHGTTGSVDLAFAHRRSCLLFYFQLRFNCPAIVMPFKRPHLSRSLPVKKMAPLVLTYRLEFRYQLSPRVLCPSCSVLVQSHLSSKIRLLRTKRKLNTEASFRPCKDPKIPR